jgi:hypothetical protein
MTQKDYILRIAEVVGRALAQIIYHKEIQEYIPSTQHSLHP